MFKIGQKQKQSKATVACKLNLFVTFSTTRKLQKMLLET